MSIEHKTSNQVPIHIYAIIDEQSNRSLASKELFDMFDPDSLQEHYLLSTCNGTVSTSGRRSEGFLIESLDETCKMELPSVIECEQIPNNRHEIPVKEVVWLIRTCTTLQISYQC